jgi:hypothetical protein
MQNPFEKSICATGSFLVGSLISGLPPISVLKAAVLYTSPEKYFTDFEMLIKRE